MRRSWGAAPGYAGLLGLVAALLVGWPAHGPASRALTDAECGGGWVLHLPGQPDACAHPDAAPAGVDPRVPVETTELRTRVGAGPRAYAAAQDLGVPGTYATTATSSAVSCDGDGVSGARVQAMYVVEAGRTNRYSSLLPSMQLWAAGVDDVLNRSAALTGGTRSVRYVTDAVSGGCVARVLNVTVPAGATSSFGATVQAVQALGYTSPGRKYLMWTDASVLCGIASMYPDETAGQGNLNNGSYPQYARVDSGCWGLGNGADQHSVEAHELVHTLGGVQNLAPHSTHAGHCWDEADTMCYADGGTHAMVSVCPAEREYLLDCNSDDYFSTYPTGYLATAWDAASSRFLIGGGDGSSGGTLGAPTSLGGTLAVNNPAVPGLPTQATVSPELPAGRALTSVAWRVASSACVVTPTGDGTQATVTCPAATTAATSVTATLTDSTGATKAITSPVTFQTLGTKRPVALAVSVDGQSPAAGVCTGVPAAVRAVVVDAASGVPVKGLTTSFTRQATGALAPSTAGSRVTATDGSATAVLGATTETAFGAASAALGMFQAGSASTVLATPSRCTASLTAAPSTLSTWYGGLVTVSGTLRRTVATTDDTPVVGAPLSVTVRTPDSLSSTGTVVAGRTLTVGSVTTTAAGTFSGTFRATTAGALAVTQPATAGFVGTSTALGDLEVRIPTTALTGSTDLTDVGYGSTVTVRGTLLKTADATTPVAGALVTVRVAAPGRAPAAVASGVVRADGGYTIAFPARVSGDVSVAYAGSAGLPAASAPAGSITVGTWTPTLSLSASAPSVLLGGSVRCTGTVTRAYGGTTEPARGLRLTLVLTPASGAAPVVLGYAATTSTGTFSVLAYPRVSGTLTAVVSGVVGYTSAASDPVAVTVS